MTMDAKTATLLSTDMTGGVVLGCSANGRIEWQTKDGRTLKAVQEIEAGE